MKGCLAMKRFNWVRVAGMAACAVLATASMGDLIVYEGFDCDAANNAPLTGLTGATSFGFRDGSAWSMNSANGVATSAFRTSGLFLADVDGSPSLLPRIGGAAFVESKGSAWQTGRTSRSLSVGANAIWGSVLFRLGTAWSSTSLALMATQGPFTDDTGAELNLACKEWAKGNVGLRLKGTSGEIEIGGTAIAQDATYIMLFKATSLNGTSGTTVFRTWVLSSAQFQHFKADGLTEAELDAATLGTAVGQVRQRGERSSPAGTRATFRAGDYLMLWSKISDSVGSEASAQFDELRISNTSLDEATPLLMVLNHPGVALTTSSAEFRATLVSPSVDGLDAYVFWGTSDGGQDAGAWQHSALVATGLDATATGTVLSYTATGLDRDRHQYFRFAVSNASGRVWSTIPGQAVGTFAVDGYSRRQPIDFDGYAKTLTLTNFPALVRFTAEHLGASASGMGYDLCFTDADGAPLDFEIDSWNPTDGWNVWVRVPLLTSATRIWAYSGNASLAGYPSYYARRGGVWSPEFRTVWHLGENVTDDQTDGVHADATANALDLLQRGNGPVEGIVGRAQRTEKAKNEYLLAPYQSTSPLNAGDKLTLSAWVRWHGLAPANSSRLFARKNNFADPNGFEIVQFYNTNPIRHEFWVRGTGAQNPATHVCTTLSAVANDWWHMTVRFNGTVATVFKNGELVTGTGAIAAVANNTYGLVIGNYSNSGAFTSGFNGDFDEVRLEAAVRPADWVWAVWKNMADNTGFQTYGPVEALGGSLILIR